MLETRVSSLLDERDRLQAEIGALRGELEQERAGGPLREKITELQAELAREQVVREVAAQRIDALLLRVRERIPE